MANITCDYDCENCNRYVSARFDTDSREFTCGVVDKVVEKQLDKDGNVIRVKVW